MSQDLRLSELLTLLKAANDGGEVVRTTAGGKHVRSRTGVTIHEDGTGWFAGLRFDTTDQLLALMQRRADPDHGMNDIPKDVCQDCGMAPSQCGGH